MPPTTTTSSSSSFPPPSTSVSSSTQTPSSSHPPSSAAAIPPIPTSILIVGSGIFGLSTAYALSQRSAFDKTSITVVDRSNDPSLFPSRDASSVDTSRIIRADYADPAYAALASRALEHWRKQDPGELGGDGRYNETGLLLVADKSPTTDDATSSSSSAISPGQAKPTKLTGMDYVKMSWENVVNIAKGDPKLAGKIQVLPNRDAIREVAGTGGVSGDWGYINRSSGWADADKSMQWLYERVKATGRVDFVSDTVERLQHHDKKVTGVKLSSGEDLSADLVIVAAGAWSPSLVDLSGQVIATGQVLGYIDITAEEQAKLDKMHTTLNLTTGLFIITPSNRVLKAARHAFGYLNPVKVSNMLRTSSSPQDTTVSRPWTHLDDPNACIPKEGLDDLRLAVKQLTPDIDRPFRSTRLCWYSDTPTGDFLVSYHPSWDGLFIAAGCSGHAFKFLPVIGDEVVDTLLGHCPEAFKQKWAWKQAPTHSTWNSVETQDGSRGGTPGMLLGDELQKSHALGCGTHH